MNSQDARNIMVNNHTALIRSLDPYHSVVVNLFQSSQEWWFYPRIDSYHSYRFRRLFPRVNMSNVLRCSGWCAMDMTSPCYGCGRSIHPTMILPPSKNKDRNQSRRRNIHSCGAPDCPGRDHYRGTLPFGPVGTSLFNGVQRFNFIVFIETDINVTIQYNNLFKNLRKVQEYTFYTSKVHI